MKVIIVGCGKVGETLAAELNDEGNDVTVVDQNSKKVKYIANKYDIMGVIGNGATREVQKEAGVDTADLIIAVTGSDELNLLCCLMAKKSGDCHTIARIKNPEYAQDAPHLRDELGLAMVINPEYAAAEEIKRILNFPSAIKVETFSKGRVELVKFRMPENSPLIGLSLRDAMIKFKSNVLVCTVERSEEAYIPKGDFVFAEKDVISIIASAKSAADFFDKIGYKSHRVKSVTVIGGSDITHYLCELLDRSGMRIKIIEKAPEKCSELASKFPNVTVINGDPADEDTLVEEGAAEGDAFIALTSHDEENILLSLFAKNADCRKVITKINRIEYDGVISKLDLDSIIYPKNLTADMIIRYIRARQNTLGSNMETLYNLIKGEVEVAEFTVSESSPIIGKPLSELKFKDNALVAAILRDRQLIIPRGQAVINAGDSVVTVTKLLALRDISDILA
ncbi:MAG: Trk system potassium transporter TrkA [Clostridia bacterium]|nr:Trk system potassium transporter TrkA [Clostridia bacterium]